MTTELTVKLWGSDIGAVALDERTGVASFQYDHRFLQSGVEVSPLTMPLSSNVYAFPELPKRTFHGLPGMLADSLPDRFGNQLINTWLASRGRDEDS